MANTIHRRVFSSTRQQVLAWFDRLGWVPSRATTYLGHQFAYPLDSLIGRKIAAGKEWDANLAVIIPALLPMDEPAICEVGSNIGASLLQIMKVKPRARVVAFEPSDRFRPFLERNLRLAGVKQVEILPLLVGRSQGVIWLYNNASSASVDHVRPELKPRRKQPAFMTALDEVYRQRPRLDFIKVDTDGFDLEVLRGAEEILKRDAPALYFELFPALLPTTSTLALDLAWLQGAGYARFVCFTPPGKLLGLTGDVEQLISWANEDDYCDVLVCAAGSPAEVRLEELLRHFAVEAAR